MPIPIPKFRFSVEFDVDGTPVKAGFTEVSGLDKETEVIEYREGADDSKYKRVILGLSKANRVTCKRGVFNDDTKLQFYNWWKKTIDKQTTEAAQKNVIIKLLDEIGDPVITWSLNNAIAVKMQSTDLKSDGNEIAIESIELMHEGLTIQDS
ncbi:MAG: phage tail protein [Bacteroidota bacterium]